MVVMIMACTGCGKSGTFDIHIEFEAEHDRCSKCSHDSSHPWRFQFCILPCFIDWLARKKVAELGFPCQRCTDMETGEPSGFFYGHKENGICKTCDGTKTVKGRAVAIDPMVEIEKKRGIGGQRP